MSLVISDSVLQSANITDNELRVEIAVLLFAQNRFTLGQASEFCGMPQVQFQNILGEREIPIHYNEEDFLEDMKTLESFHP